MNELPKLVESREAFSGAIFSVRVDTLEVDGSSRRVDIVAHRGSIAILALAAPERLILIRQYRHPAGRELWEIPAGMREPGEDAGVGAARELREETGYTAGRITPMFAAYATPGFCTELLHFFLAEELQSGLPEPDADERIDVREVSLAEAFAMQASGQIADLKTFAALLWLGRKLHQ
ncbi:MAG TPA: NUDIX hydrolase [Candidatus Baltobacteraceae bacterium]|jgi:ADP-ribose pyrophosphatase